MWGLVILIFVLLAVASSVVAAVLLVRRHPMAVPTPTPNPGWTARPFTSPTAVWTDPATGRSPVEPPVTLTTKGGNKLTFSGPGYFKLDEGEVYTVVTVAKGFSVQFTKMGISYLVNTYDSPVTETLSALHQTGWTTMFVNAF